MRDSLRYDFWAFFMTVIAADPEMRPTADQCLSYGWLSTVDDV